MPGFATARQVSPGEVSCPLPENIGSPPATLDEMDTRGEIYWSSTGNPRRKIYLENSSGVPLQNIWMDMRDAHNQNIHITGYPMRSPGSISAHH